MKTSRSSFALTAALLLGAFLHAPAFSQELIAEFGTGGDDLRGGNDNVHLIVVLRSGSPLRFLNVNDLRRWEGGSRHTVRRPLPATFNPAQITAVRLETTFGGGIDGDNWNLDYLSVNVRQGGATRHLFEARGAPLFRFTGEQRGHDFAFARQQCATNRDCDDGIFCNGEERCTVRSAGGLDTWACAAPAGPVSCPTGQACSETQDTCVAQRIDKDGDGVESFEDCDDNDAGRYPGATEVCDSEGKDEDCDFQTSGARDSDRDGFKDAACFNWGPPPSR